MTYTLGPGISYFALAMINYNQMLLKEERVYFSIRFQGDRVYYGDKGMPQ